MEVKKFIDRLIGDQRKIENLVQKIDARRNGPEAKLKLLLKHYEFVKTSPILLGKLCDTLQLINDDKVLQKFSLDDIENLFKTNIKLNPNNLQAYFEYSNFLYSVLDNEKKAKEIFKKGLAILKRMEKEQKTLSNRF